ncbi:hypothetical protein OV203_01335 [Nannocystis sp. ILAH1]|uniref:hypothetical protein n=1 Tax=Nannocystis sp. ILAH1 TaxID=2996789 RepID=UPI0022701F36|nr:hypothetical protein [Nannocystis sp. ILAH1]MCY0985753.1 hypothetical protein [Nannocystis sp. ILAH1]
MRYFRTGARAVRPRESTSKLIDDATRHPRRSPEHHAEAAAAWKELRRRSWGMQALCSRTTLPLHRALGNDPKLDRFLSMVLGAHGDGAVALELSYEQGASELGRSRSSWWRYRQQAADEGWVCVMKSSEVRKNEARSKTNLYFPGPTLLDRLSNPDVAKSLRREAEVAIYGKQRGTEPRQPARQEPLLPDLEPAEQDCPRGAWADAVETTSEDDVIAQGEQVHPDQLALIALIEAASEPPVPAAPAVGERAEVERQATREGWERTEEGWRLEVQSGLDTTSVSMTDDELQNFFARRHPSRIATTTPEFKKLREESDQGARVRQDMAEKTARRGRGLPAPPRLELDEGSAAVLARMWSRATSPGVSPDPELRRLSLRFSAAIDAGGTPPAQAEALAAVVAHATARGSPHGARVAAFAELARAVAAMPAPPPALHRMAETLGHVLKDYPASADEEDGSVLK